MGVALLTGAFLARTQALQSSRHLPDGGASLELVMIGLVMWPSFQQQVQPALSKASSPGITRSPQCTRFLG
jgi:hypothetical protein